MSTEKIINVDAKNLINLNSPEISTKKSNGRVDINHLLARVRKEQQKDNKTNLLFFGLFVTLIVISGILLSF
jgi:hypothetical protein